MSICINNDLIWVAIPRCAIYSVQTALLNSDLNIKLYSEYERDFKTLHDSDMHAHFKVNTLKNEFGDKETICVKRNWIERWVSGFEHIFNYLHKLGYSTKISPQDIDNNYIYNTVNNEFVNLLYGDTIKIFEILSNDKFDMEFYNDGMFRIILSQNFWKLNKPCTYEFDINELDKMQEFLKKRYNTDVTIPKLNSTPKVMNKIVINDDLKNWIWDLFERRYTVNNLI